MMLDCSARRGWGLKHRFCMRVLLVIIACLVSVNAQDITTLETIGPVVGVEKTDKTVRIHCHDNSEVQLTILAPDLIRVRTSFTKPIPQTEHSWAIAKEDWQTPRWNLQETSDSITITTDELEIVVHR